MGQDLWKITFEHISDSLSDEEYNFLTGHAARSDDGNYYIDEEILKDALADMTAEETDKIQNLLKILREQFKKEEASGLSFNF